MAARVPLQRRPAFGVAAFLAVGLAVGSAVATPTLGDIRASRATSGPVVNSALGALERSERAVVNRASMPAMGNAKASPQSPAPRVPVVHYASAKRAAREAAAQAAYETIREPTFRYEKWYGADWDDEHRSASSAVAALPAGPGTKPNVEKKTVAVLPYAAERFSSLRAFLARTREGKAALAVAERYDVKVYFVDGASVYGMFVPNKNHILLRATDSDETTASTFIHEMTHAEEMHTGRTAFGKASQFPRAEYVERMLREEAKAASREADAFRDARRADRRDGIHTEASLWRPAKNYLTSYAETIRAERQRIVASRRPPAGE